MPASSTQLRKAPQRRFEDYTLNRIVSPEVGLYPIATSAMTEVPGWTTSGPTGGAPGADDGPSINLDLGFVFHFDGIDYTQIEVTPNGVAVLIDPATSPISGTVIGDCTFVTYDNSSIRSPFNATANHVLLCVWFDDLRNLYKTGKDFRDDFPSQITDQQLLYQQRGLDLPNERYNAVEYGIKYAYVTTKEGIRATVFRWNSLSNFSFAGSKLRFDLVIYENGVIEYRYHTRIGIYKTDPVHLESATIGVFLNNDPNSPSYWRFRDFTVGMGYRDQDRTPYRLGGYVYDSTYVDGLSSVPYTVNLTPELHWPGLNSEGCVMRFTPPQNRRKILPRRELAQRDARTSYPLAARTGDGDRLGTRLSAFDDRRTLTYVPGVVVDYPTTIPRRYADSEPGAPDRINLFGSMEVTGSIIKGNADTFIGNEPKQFITPFSDHERPEQSRSSQVYYATGSNVDIFGDNLKEPLSAKTQIKLELPIEYATWMFETTSSIYYYNVQSRGWYVPRNVVTNLGHGNYDLSDPLAALDYLVNPEDARGFGALGNSISSGSHNQNLGQQTDAVLGFSSPPPFNLNLDKLSSILSRQYPNSVQTNPKYLATSDEQFELPINHPFLIEKVIFEIPMTMGPGWFNDRTTTSVPITSAYNGGINFYTYDFAGPAITVSLFNQQQAGPNTYRDLITSGTVIPLGDNYANVKATKVYYYTGIGILPAWIFSPEGFVSYNATPSSVVRPDGDNYFTGSIEIPTIAGVSNGIIAEYTSIFADPDIESNRVNVLKWLTSPTVDVNSTTEIFEGGSGITVVKDVDPFGRAATGFNPSGRSVFGKEFVTTQTSINSRGQFKNPLFISASTTSSTSSLPQNYQNAINDPNFVAAVISAINVGSTYPSPYLVLPGDKLTLALSKMRPSIFTNGQDNLTSSLPVDYFTASLRHDVTLPTGTIKITLYGTLLRESRERHSTLNQPLSSDTIHETIGDDPVLDQYNVEYPGSYWGTYTDDYITGSMLSIVSSGGSRYFVTGSRGKVFQRLDARSQPAPASSPITSYEVQQNNSKSFRLQPWYERANRPIVTQLLSDSETYYDSMVPDLAQCLKASGNGIWILKNGDVPPAPFDSTKVKVGPTVGYLYFNNQVDSASETIESLANGVWTWSYPFEPRYSDIPRSIGMSKSLVAEREYSSGSNMISPITPHEIDTFYPIFVGTTPHVGFFEDYLHLALNQFAISWQIAADVDLRRSSPYYLTSSLSPDDMIRVMYGYGDINTMVPQKVTGSWPNVTPDYTSSSVAGCNNQPAWRDQEIAKGLYATYLVGPIIRGWKYGLYNGLPVKSHATFRRDRYGQNRDMLEQRPFTKYYQATDTADNKAGVLRSAVQVTFVDSQGRITPPENTWSQNLSTEATSSMPYFDGQAVNRPDPNPAALNQSIITFTSNVFGNLTV